jgi:hypothetical protein
MAALETAIVRLRGANGVRQKDRETEKHDWLSWFDFKSVPL